MPARLIVVQLIQPISLEIKFEELGGCSTQIELDSWALLAGIKLRSEHSPSSFTL